MTETVRGHAGPTAPTPMDAPRAAGVVADANRAGAAPTIAIVGAGRAGSALAVALAAAGHTVAAISSRDRGAAESLAARVGARPVPSALAAIRAAGFTLLTVPDAAITPVAASVAGSGASLHGRGVVHCCGSLGVEALAALRVTGAAVGCLHPLQALTGVASAPLVRETLMAIDGDTALRGTLERIVRSLGGHPVVLRPGSRALYHAAAVLAGNAPLALLATAAELLAATGMEPGTAEEGLISLMHGALANAGRVGPRAALTGPVARGDTATVAASLAALEDRPEVAELYRVLARATLRLAGEEGRRDMAQLLDGRRREDPGVPAERRLSAGGSGNAAGESTRHAAQGARTPGLERSTTPESPFPTEDSTCR